MKIFFQHLNEPEYMHVLLNPLPVYGLAIGVVGLLLAVVARNRTGIVIALVLVFLSGLSAWTTYHYGEAAYDRVKAMTDTTGDQWLDEHMARGEKLIYAFYVLAGLALVGMFAPMKWPRSSLQLAIATLLIGCTTLGIGFYIAYAGGHVRHSEFRFEAPPLPRMAEHHHEEEQHGAETHEHATEQKPAQPQTEHAGHEEMQPKPEEAKSEQERKQLEASRLQLEASRKQLEASRKQLEAAGGSPSASSGGSPGASPSPQLSPGQHKHDEHHHDQPKP